MKKQGLLDHPKFKKFIRKIAAGTPLFRQGENGNTMFIVLDGTVQLIAERAGSAHVAGLLESGDFIGERAILGKDVHVRHFSAKADTDITILELSGQDLELLKIAAPELMTEVMTKIFEVAAKRLSLLNFLIRGLRSTNNEQRVAHCILYFAHAIGKAVPQGIEFIVSPQGIAYYIDMDPTQIAVHLDRLVALRMIEKLNAPYYLLSNDKALVEYINSQSFATVA